MSLWRRNVSVVAALVITAFLFFQLDIPVEKAIHDLNYFSSPATDHTTSPYVPHVTHIWAPTISAPASVPSDVVPASHHEENPDPAPAEIAHAPVPEGPGLEPLPLEDVQEPHADEATPNPLPEEVAPELQPEVSIPDSRPEEAVSDPLPAETDPDTLPAEPNLDPSTSESIPEPPPSDPEPPQADPDTPPTAPEQLQIEPVSRLHFLIPASGSNLPFCYNLASSAANRYPVPVILGYNGTGEFDAAATHLAKLRSIQRYLDSLKRQDDDDLVLIVDGYDILLQLPPEILIDRYFEVAHKADGRLAQRFGISVEEARSRGIRTSIFWGPDKICWPIDNTAPRCWSVPPSPLGRYAHGPATDNGDMMFSNPRWLNSGTVLGRAADMKALLAGTMEEIKATYDPHYEFKESDQYYVSNVWGRQEYHRSIMANHGGIPGGGPPDRRTPELLYEGQRVEYHVGLDYESALFFPRGGNEILYDYLPFNTSGLNAKVDVDILGLGDRFVPYDIPMPANIMSALGRLYESIQESHPGHFNSWLRTISLGLSLVTQQIYPLWHCTGIKEPIAREYTYMWFYPYAKSLIQATVKAFQSGEPITTYPVEGRKWEPKMTYPNADELTDELGGAWVDFDGLNFVNWDELCGRYGDKLFAGELPP